MSESLALRSPAETFDVAVVGAGIVGLANAWMAAARGLRVVLLERSPLATGASVRNFGMVWPIGQPAGERYRMALRSRELWMHLGEHTDVWVNRCGSLHLAHHDDEWSVLQEYVQQNQSAGNGVELFDPEQTMRKTSAARATGLRGAMWSPAELCVNPPQAIARIPGWLEATYQVECHFNTAVSHIDGNRLLASDGRSWQADQIVVCSGSDFQTLLPEAFQKIDLKVCKLQMMRTSAQPDGWRLGPHLASGLTLRHYESFLQCPSLPRLQQRIQEESPELDRYGVHVMASQNELGQVVLGDSHEYEQTDSPFDKTMIDRLILREVQKQFQLPSWDIEARWHGVYAKFPGNVIYSAQPQPGVRVCVAPGGAGMTMSFGWADQFWKEQTSQEIEI